MFPRTVLGVYMDIDRDSVYRLRIGLAIVALYFTTIYLVITVLARYFRDLGFSISEIGFLWSLASLSAISIRLFVGYIADRIGSILSMAIGTLLSLVSIALYALTQGVYPLAVARVFQGLANGFFIPTSIVAIASIVDSASGFVLGLRSMVIAITSFVIPPIAGYLADVYGYKFVFLLASISSIIALSLCIYLDRVSSNSRTLHRVHTYGSSVLGSFRDALNRVVLLMMFVAICNGVVFFTISSIVQTHYRDLGYGARVYGYFTLFFGLFSALSRYLAGKAMYRWNPVSIALTGFIVVAISMALLSIYFEPPTSFIIASIYGFGLGLVIPTQQIVVLNSVPRNARNRATAIYTIGLDLGGLIGPPIYGAIAQHYGYTQSYLTLAIPSLIAIVLLSIVRKYLSQGWVHHVSDH